MLWPRAHSPSAITDPVTEARMTVEQKVGQVIQADISAIQPSDLARWAPSWPAAIRARTTTSVPAPATESGW